MAVVRLRVSRDGQLQYGEAIDAETERSRGFRSWTGLVDCLGDLISEQAADPPADRTGGSKQQAASPTVALPTERRKPS